jgi:hypothetical protein
MKIIPIFPEYIFEFDYPDHDKYYENWTSSIMRGEYPSKREPPRGSKKPVTFTHHDLHEKEFFAPITQFMHECLRQSMVQMGYLDNVKITSMWGTHQREKQHHPFHYHPNSFLSAVYYCYTDSPNTSGTVFINSNINRLDMIRPEPDPQREMLIRGDHHIPFHMGKVIVFGSSILHRTEINTDGHRVILALNSMPSGPTNTNRIETYHFWE